MSVRGDRGSHSRFCSSVPNMPQRLGDADRLVRGQQRRQRRVPDAGHRQRAVVVDLREPEPAVLLGDLHPQRADAA